MTPPVTVLAPSHANLPSRRQPETKAALCSSQLQRDLEHLQVGMGFIGDSEGQQNSSKRDVPKSLKGKHTEGTQPLGRRAGNRCSPGDLIRFTLRGAHSWAWGLRPCGQRQMRPGIANRHLSIFLLESTQREPPAFSETGQKRNKILLKADVNLFTGGSVPVQVTTLESPQTCLCRLGGGAGGTGKREGPMAKWGPGLNVSRRAPGWRKPACKQKWELEPLPRAAPVSRCSRKSAKPRRLSKSMEILAEGSQGIS